MQIELCSLKNLPSYLESAVVSCTTVQVETTAQNFDRRAIHMPDPKNILLVPPIPSHYIRTAQMPESQKTAFHILDKKSIEENGKFNPEKMSPSIQMSMLKHH